MNPGIVMRSKVVVKIDNSVYWEWFIVTHPLRPMRSVSRKRAMEYIDENGLVVAEKNADGTIWDTPDRAFKRAFKGIFSDKKKKSLFDEIWE